MKQFYDRDDIGFRFPKILEFYEKFSDIFPNYVTLEQSGIMMKNILRKQKAVDDKHNALNNVKNNKKMYDSCNNTISAAHKSDILNSGVLSFIMSNQGSLLFISSSICSL